MRNERAITTSTRFLDLTNYIVQPPNPQVSWLSNDGRDYIGNMGLCQAEFFSSILTTLRCPQKNRDRHSQPLQTAARLEPVPIFLNKKQRIKKAL
jgi:hypothetical protein